MSEMADKRIFVHVSPVESSVQNVPFVDKCPTSMCNGELISGFGLAFGGMGPYQYCDSCGWATKHPEPDE